MQESKSLATSDAVRAVCATGVARSRGEEVTTSDREQVVRPATRAVSEVLAAASLFAVLTFVLLYPLFVAPGSTLFDPAIRGGLSLFSLGDIYTVIWVLSWDAHAVWSNPAGLFDANIFHPAPNALTSSEHMLGHLPIFGPVYALSANPVLANQVNLFASLTLCGLAMYLLLRHWGVGRFGAFAGGVVFAYCPLRLTFVTHVHLIAGEYLVVALIALDRLLLSGRKRWAVALAAAVGLQCLCSFYLAYMSLIGLASYGAAIVVLRRREVGGRALAMAALAGVVGLVPFLLLAIPYLEGRQAGTLPEAQELALLRYLSVRLQRLFLVREEGYYAGLSVAVLAALGLVSRRPRLPIAWARLGALAIAVVSVAFAMGPGGEVWGVSMPSPYDAASRLIPGFAAMRGPIRFVLVAMVGLAALAGFGFDRLARSRWPVAGAGPVLALAALAVVGWDYGLAARNFPARAAEVGDRLPPVYRELARLAPGPVLEVPAGGRDEPVEQARESAYTYRSIFHWQELLNGRTGYPPPSYRPLMALARTLPDPRALQLLQRSAGLRYVVVHFKHLELAEWSRWAGAPGLRKLGRFGDAVLFEVAERLPADLVGALLDEESDTSVLGAPLMPLSAAERRGSLRVVRPPAEAAVGVPLKLDLIVTSASPTRTWPAFSPADLHRVRLGYRWLDAQGRVVAEQVDADRVPYDLAPGESVRVGAAVPVQLPPGVYDLTVGVTQGQDWFEGVSDSLRVEVVPYREPVLDQTGRAK